MKAHAPPAGGKLPVEFRANLPDARIARAGYQAELVAAEIAVRVVELSVVKDVEKLSTNFECNGLSDGRPLRDAHIRVVDSGAMKKLAICVPELSKRSGRKGTRQEKCVGAGGVTGIRIARILKYNFTYEVGNVGISTANKGVIAALPDSNRETPGKTGNAVDGPSLG